MTNTEVKAFKSTLIRDNPFVDRFITELKRIKLNPEYKSSILGADRDFWQPQSAKDEGLMHFHIIELEPTQQTSDAFLIYCQGFANPNYYLVIDVILKDAHQKCRDMNKMRDYASVAALFRNKY